MNVTSNAESQFDVRDARSRFPALSKSNSRGLVPMYFDGPGGTQVPQTVVDAMGDYLVASNSNTEGLYEASVATDVLVSEARRAGGAFVNGDPDGIGFGQNMTTLNFLLTRAFARSLEPGDEIVTTTLDHEGNVSPWLLVAKDFGLVVRTVGVTPTLELDIEELKGLVNGRTRVIASTLCSNAVGTLTPAREIADIAHEVGALAWFDAVAFAPHRRIDVTAFGGDVLLCSPYKFFGPHLGMAWVRPDLASVWDTERVRPASNVPSGHRFETGTIAHEALAGFVAAVEYLAGLGSGSTLPERLDSAFQAIKTYEGSLTRRFLEGLEAIDSWQVLGVQSPDSDRRSATFGLLHDSGSPAEWAQKLGEASAYAWNGNFYALGLVQHLGLDVESGLLRIGFNHYNTPDEVDRLLTLLAG